MDRPEDAPVDAPVDASASPPAGPANGSPPLASPAEPEPDPPGPTEPAQAPSAPEVRALGEGFPRLLEFLEVMAVAIVFALFVRTFVVQAFKIPSGSMEDNLLVGDHILVNKFIYGPRATKLEEWLLPVRDPRRGDVVVFKYPDGPQRDFIKRCVALPGDEVEIVDKQLSVNGEAVVEEGYKQHVDDRVYSRSSYLQRGYRRRDNFGPYLVPPASYFCLGDNRDRSHDSRLWNQTTVPHSYLKGRAVMVYWSLDPRVSPAVGSLPERVGQRVSEMPQRVRVERLLKPVR